MSRGGIERACATLRSHDDGHLSACTYRFIRHTLHALPLCRIQRLLNGRIDVTLGIPDLFGFREDGGETWICGRVRRVRARGA